MGHSWAGGGMGLQVTVGRAVLNQGCIPCGGTGLRFAQNWGRSKQPNQ